MTTKVTVEAASHDVMIEIQDRYISYDENGKSISNSGLELIKIGKGESWFGHSTTTRTITVIDLEHMKEASL